VVVVSTLTHHIHIPVGVLQAPAAAALPGLPLPGEPVEGWRERGWAAEWQGHVPVLQPVSR
jgi:hypothetical protein